MVKNYTFMIDQLWPFFFDRCVQFVQLTTVDIRINRLVPWKQLKKYYTFPIQPNRQHNLFLMQFSFRCCLWLFITFGPWSFSNEVIVNNPFFIISDNLFQKRIEIMWNPNIKFFNEYKTLYMTVDCWLWYFWHFFNLLHSYMTIRFNYGFNLVINFICPTWTLLIFEWKIPRKEFIKLILTLFFKASSLYISRNFLVAYAAFFPLRE